MITAIYAHMSTRRRREAGGVPQVSLYARLTAIRRRRATRRRTRRAAKRAIARRAARTTRPTVFAMSAVASATATPPTWQIHEPGPPRSRATSQARPVAERCSDY